MIDDKTASQHWPLPHPGNLLSDDVLRLRSALQDADAAMAALQAENAGLKDGVASAAALAESVNCALQSGLSATAEQIEAVLNSKITKDRLGASAVTTVALADSAVTGTKVTDKTISHPKLVIGDAINLLAEPRFDNGGVGWRFAYPAAVAVVSIAGPDGYDISVLRFTPDRDDFNAADNNAFTLVNDNKKLRPVVAGTTFRFSMRARLVSGNAGKLRMRTLEKNNASGPNSWPVVTNDLNAATATPGKWVVLTGTRTVSSGMNYLGVHIHATGATGAVFEVSEVVMQQVTAGKLAVKEFLTSGTFTPSALLVANGGGCWVRLRGGCGGGAGGGAGHAASSSGMGVGGGGGGGGGLGDDTTEMVTVLANVSVVIGGGGAGGAPGAAGGDGGSSSFGALTVLGGKGGEPGKAAGYSIGGDGGAGGAGSLLGSGCGGDGGAAGGTGGAAGSGFGSPGGTQKTASYGGNGGSGARSMGCGFVPGGTGGVAAIPVGGDGGNGQAVDSSHWAGGNGGGGGGGTASSNAYPGAGGAGGAGSPGRVTVWWYE